MKILSLCGEWGFKKEKDQTYMKATVPGCNFTDLIANGKIEDPFLGTNEAGVQWVSKENWVYRKLFPVTSEMLAHERVELVCQQLDTLAVVCVNGKEIARTDNVNRVYVLDIRSALTEGENELTILFQSPLPYIQQRQRILKLPHNTMGVPGCPHIRKTPCHFGWDFGPTLIASGITRDVFIRAYSIGRIVEVESTQSHQANTAKLTVKCLTEQLTHKDIYCKIDITTPGGDLVSKHVKVVSNVAKTTFQIDNPELWWCNGLGKQPLYTVNCTLICEEEEADTHTQRIGLRTIRLDTAKDAYGSNFCFVVNGAPIFAKGANWIPADSFNTRVTEEKLRYMLGAMKNANMNLVRVWGGGYYESDTFYDICDELGLLVWQDMSFACSGYPFPLDDFKENVFKEVQDNVRRLRHHASLCLWCGNNEIESMSGVWLYRRKIIQSTGEFFYQILPNWIRKFDKNTNYWNCSPSSGKYMRAINSDKFGDTHLWNVWHGMRDVNFYRKRYTRFCSEFGLESYPSTNCINRIIPESAHHLQSKEVNAHQKCGDGDTKMLYYVNKRFWEPRRFFGLVYLTQLTQMECIRDATEHWRRHMDRCHGALYWQFDDIWPGTSWASMDYDGNYKALLYDARHFNEPVALSLENKWYKINLFTLNDTLDTIKGSCTWRLELFNGNVIDKGTMPLTLNPISAAEVARFDFKSKLEAGNQKHAVFVAVLKDSAGNVVSTRRALIYRERQAPLPKAKLRTQVTVQKGLASIKVTADAYARFICLNMDQYTKPFSDNYFDLSKGESSTVTIPVPAEWSEETIRAKLECFSLCDVEPQMSRTQDRLKETLIALKPMNVANWIARFFDK